MKEVKSTLKYLNILKILPLLKLFCEIVNLLFFLQHMRQIHSIMDAYNERLNGKLLIKTNAVSDTKYPTLKRNGDFINSLLTLPKGLLDAGR